MSNSSLFLGAFILANALPYHATAGCVLTSRGPDCLSVVSPLLFFLSRHAERQALSGGTIREINAYLRPLFLLLEGESCPWLASKFGPG